MGSVLVSNRGNKEERRKNLAQLIRTKCTYLQYEYAILSS